MGHQSDQSGTPIRCERATNPVEVDSLACSAVGPYVAGYGVLPSHGEPCYTRAYFVGERLWHRSLNVYIGAHVAFPVFQGKVGDPWYAPGADYPHHWIGYRTGRMAIQAVKLEVGSFPNQSYNPIYILCLS